MPYGCQFTNIQYKASGIVELSISSRIVTQLNATRKKRTRVGGLTHHLMPFHNIVAPNVHLSKISVIVCGLYCATQPA